MINVMAFIAAGECLLFQAENFMNTVDKILGLLPAGKVDLEDLVKIYSDPMDKLIMKRESEGNIYGAGGFYINYISETQFQLQYKLYFKNPENKWIEISSSSSNQNMGHLTDNARKRLQNEQIIKYPVYASK